MIIIILPIFFAFVVGGNSGTYRNDDERQRLVGLILFAMTVSCSSAPSTTPVTTPMPPVAPLKTPKAALSLRYSAQVRGIQIGAAVEATRLRSETLYAQTLAREFSIVTPENAMKFESCIRTKTATTFARRMR